MSTAFIIIVGLCLGIAGYCVGFYAGAEATTQKVLDMIKDYMSNYSNFRKAEQKVKKQESNLNKSENDSE